MILASSYRTLYIAYMLRYDYMLVFSNSVYRMMAQTPAVKLRLGEYYRDSLIRKQY